MDQDIKIDLNKSVTQFKERASAYYYILITQGYAHFTIDFTTYTIQGTHMIFLSPYQLLTWFESDFKTCIQIRFHGDFYCIEYHKKEVACNGILFNSIYHEPFLSISKHTFTQISYCLEKIGELSNTELDYPIIKTYLQLILALSSKEKQLSSNWQFVQQTHSESVTSFKEMLDLHFAKQRQVSFYADIFGLSTDAFSKKIRKIYGKPPTKLIQERVVLESKKLLHLTYKPIKEIAQELCFEDEFYFSRYFKKQVGISPKKFRDQVGISIVAEKAM